MVRELHVVALSEDGRSVLLATSKNATTGGFRVKIEGKLSAAVRGDLPRPGESDVRAATVTPKEIQARMRAGESAEEIAAEAGVPVARVERFAGPVLSERERIIEEARAAYLSRGRLGPSLLPLGDAVDAVLAETPSLRGDSVTWSARRLDSGHWLVQVSYVARARQRTGSWVYDPHTRSLVPSDQPSAVMGHTGEDAGARKPVRALPATTARTPARKKPARPAAKSARPARAAKSARPAAKPVKAAKPPAKAAAKPAARTAAKAAARPAAKPAAKAAARPTAKAAKPAATKATPRRVPKPKAAPVRTATPAAAERAAEKLAAAMARPAEEQQVEAFEPAVHVPPPSSEPAPAPVPEPEPVEEVVAAAPEPEPEPERPPLRVVPEPPAELTPTPVPKRRAAGERAHVPDWADVLFGAAPRKDRKDG